MCLSAAGVVSLVDRLIHHSEIIVLEGESYRMKEAQERAQEKKQALKYGDEIEETHKII